MKYSSVGGEVITYTAPIASNDVVGNPLDADNFYPADGEAYGNDMVGDEGGTFDYASGDPFFSEAIGGRKKKSKKKKGGFFNQLLENQREKNKMKFEAKKTQAEAQKTAAESLGKESQSDVELAKAISAGAPAAGNSSNKGMSTGVKVAIAVGVVAVVAIGGYFLYKKMGKGGK